MMVDISIISIIVFVVVVLIVIKVTKQVAKTLFMASAILLILFVVSGFLLLSDVKDLRGNFASDSSLYLLNKDGTILCGISGNFAEGSEPVFIKQDKLVSIQDDFDDDDFVSVKGDNFKLFILDLESFVDIDFSDDKFDKQEIFDLLQSSFPIDDYLKSAVPKGTSDSQYQVVKQQFMQDSNIIDDPGFKSILFGMLLQSALDSNPLFLFQSFQEERVVVFPETITFKFVRMIPSSLIGSLVG